MKKILSVAIIVAGLWVSCSGEKTFTREDGSVLTARPSGCGSEGNKVDGVEYEHGDNIVIHYDCKPVSMVGRIFNEYYCNKQKKDYG